MNASKTDPDIAVTPAVEYAEATITAFHVRFPTQSGLRLPMDAEDYPEAWPAERARLGR